MPTSIFGGSGSVSGCALWAAHASAISHLCVVPHGQCVSLCARLYMCTNTVGRVCIVFASHALPRAPGQVFFWNFPLCHLLSHPSCTPGQMSSMGLRQSGQVRLGQVRSRQVRSDQAQSG